MPKLKSKTSYKDGTMKTSGTGSEVKRTAPFDMSGVLSAYLKAAAGRKRETPAMAAAPRMPRAAAPMGTYGADARRASDAAAGRSQQTYGGPQFAYQRGLYGMELVPTLGNITPEYASTYGVGLHGVPTSPILEAAEEAQGSARQRANEQRRLQRDYGDARYFGLIGGGRR